MDLAQELVDLLRKAKDSDEYFNPNTTDGVIDAIRLGYGDEAVPDDICKWSTDMWSR